MSNHATCRLCPEPVKHPESGLCGACYHYLYSWTRRTPTEIVQRADRVALYRRRLSVLTGGEVL